MEAAEAPSSDSRGNGIPIWPASPPVRNTSPLHNWRTKMAAHSLNHPASGRPPRTKLRPLQIQRPIDDTSLHMIPQNAQPLAFISPTEKENNP